MGTIETTEGPDRYALILSDMAHDTEQTKACQGAEQEKNKARR